MFKLSFFYSDPEEWNRKDVDILHKVGEGSDCLRLIDIWEVYMKIISEMLVFTHFLNVLLKFPILLLFPFQFIPELLHFHHLV